MSRERDLLAKGHFAALPLAALLVGHQQVLRLLLPVAVLLLLVAVARRRQLAPRIASNSRPMASCRCHRDLHAAAPSAARRAPSPTNSSSSSTITTTTNSITDRNLAAFHRSAVPGARREAKELQVLAALAWLVRRPSARTPTRRRRLRTIVMASPSHRSSPWLRRHPLPESSRTPPSRTASSMAVLLAHDLSSRPSATHRTLPPSLLLPLPLQRPPLLLLLLLHQWRHHRVVRHGHHSPRPRAPVRRYSRQRRCCRRFRVLQQRRRRRRLQPAKSLQPHRHRSHRRCWRHPEVP